MATAVTIRAQRRGTIAQVNATVNDGPGNTPVEYVAVVHTLNDDGTPKPPGQISAELQAALAANRNAQIAANIPIVTFPSTFTV